jgi:hypothetical protein
MRPRTLLVNPPLWNAYAPHLAVPLLAAVLREQGWPVTSLDLSIESIDWLLSREGLGEIGTRIDSRLRAGTRDPGLERAALLLEQATDRVEGAKQTLRSVAGLFDLESFHRAKVDLRNAMWCVSAAFAGLNFDLVANAGRYDKDSTFDVLAASRDADGNVYRWLFERHLLPHLGDPDLGLVGISASADTQLIAAMTVARLVREHRPDVHIVLGGNFTTRLVTKFRSRHPFFDLVDSFICYEGEEALPRLCRRQFEGGVDCVPGLAEVGPDGTVAVAPPADVDLAGLPFADFSGFPLQRYLSPAPVIPTFASRSCAWKCAFCAIPFASNRFRIRSADAVVSEIEHHRDRLGARHFMFVDEIMTVRTLKEVSDTLIDRRTGVHWYGETRFAAKLGGNLPARLYASGCRRLNLGLESSSQRVLDLMRKGTDVDVIDSNIDALLGAGVPIHLFVIFGFPGETPEEAQATAEYARAVIDRAHGKYGVPYASWGGSAFTLDSHSPVANEPEAFGVALRPVRAERDLALERDYDVIHPGAQSTGEQMMAAVYAEGAGAGWAFRWVERDIEEHLFLRGAFGAPVPEGQVPLPKVLPAISGGALLRLPADVSWRICEQSITSGRPEPCLVLYAGSTDCLVELPVGAAEVLRTRSARARLEGGLAKTAGWDIAEAAAWVRTLVRFGFLVPTERDGDSAGGSGAVSWLDAVLYAEAGTEFRLDDNTETGTISSVVTGRAVRLNLGGLAVWLACCEADPPLTAAALLARYPDHCRPGLEKLLLTLIAAGVIGVEADPVQATPGRTLESAVAQ